MWIYLLSLRAGLRSRFRRPGVNNHDGGQLPVLFFNAMSEHDVCNNCIFAFFISAVSDGCNQLPPISTLSQWSPSPQERGAQRQGEQSPDRRDRPRKPGNIFEKPIVVPHLVHGGDFAGKSKALLLLQVGLGVAQPAALLVSQDFFAELRLPYSVKRGERFPLNVTIFNYLDVSCWIVFFVFCCCFFCLFNKLSKLSLSSTILMWVVRLHCPWECSNFTPSIRKHFRWWWKSRQR